MTLYSAVNPYEVFLDQKGGGLNGGKIYIGQPGQDPETNPKTAYWDEAGTEVAAQPIATMGGYPRRSGTPAEVFVDGSYSIRVRDRFDQQIFYEATASSPISALVAALASFDGAGMVGFSHEAPYAVGTGTGTPSFTQSFTAVDGQTVFTMGQIPTGELWVFVNGVKLAASEFSHLGSALTLSSACEAGDIVDVADFEFEEATPLASFAGTVGAKLALTVNIKDAPFNAPMNGTDDDTPALLAAEAWLAANGRGTLHIPEGTLYLPNGVTLTQSGITYQFEGQGGSTIVTNGGTGDVISLGDGSANPNDILLSGFSVRSLVQKTGGATVRMRNGHNLRVEKCRFDAGLYDGFRFDAGAEQYIYQIDDFEINGGHRGIWVPDNVTGIVQELSVGQGIIAACDEEGVLIEQGSGLYFADGTLSILQCKKGVALAPANGKGIVASRFDGTIADSCDEAGWWIVPPGTGEIRDIVFDTIWSANNGQTSNSSGIHIDQVGGGVHGLTFNTPRSEFNAAHGIFVGGCNKVEINSHKASMNNRTGLGGSGISISTAGIDGVRIAGGHGFPLSVTESGETQEYAIDINLGDGSTILIDGVDARNGGVGGTIRDNSTGATIVNNLGFKTKNVGQGTIGTGAATTTINHGLADQPELWEVRVEAITGMYLLGIGQIRVISTSATQFVVEAVSRTTGLAVAPSADLDFAWSAAIKGA